MKKIIEITDVKINELERTSYSILFSILRISTIASLCYITLSVSYIVGKNINWFAF